METGQWVVSEVGPETGVRISRRSPMQSEHSVWGLGFRVSTGKHLGGLFLHDPLVPPGPLLLGVVVPRVSAPSGDLSPSRP